MFNLEIEITNWKKSLHKNPSLEDGYIEELESHLKDKIEDYINKGMSEEGAFEKAANEVGDIEKIGAEFFKTDTKKFRWKHPLQSFRWKPFLLTNNIKVALRKIRMNKGLSLSHFLGLSIGLAVTIIILMFIKSELSYNKYYKDVNRIYLVSWHSKEYKFTYATTPPVLRKVLRANFPQIEILAQVSNNSDIKLIRKSEFTKLKHFYYAEPEIFSLLNFKLIRGSLTEFKNNISSVVISKSVAHSLFGNENPIGKELKFSSNNNKISLKIEGVFEDAPYNSDFRPEFIANYQLFINSLPPSWRDSWGMNNPKTFIRLRKGINEKDFANSIKLVRQKYSKNKTASFGIIPITDIHLYTPDILGLFKNHGDISKVYIYGVIAFLTLLIACINFINLHTAKSLARAKEIGVRKVLGAGRSTIIKQIITEAVLITFISAIIALFLVDLLLPLFNRIFNRQLALTNFFDWNSVIGFFFFVFLVGLFSGSYSAFVMSKLQPAQTIKEQFRLGNSASFIRQGLIGFQFIIFTGLICSSYIVHSQIDYIINSEPGYSKEQLLAITIPDHKYSNSCNTFINELKGQTFIKDASLTSSIPPSLGNSLSTRIPDPKDKENSIDVNLLFTDHNYLNTLGLKLAEGRYFTANDSMEGHNNIVLNKEACAVLGLKNPVGKTIKVGSNKYLVIGVINNFKIRASYFKIPPLVIFDSRDYIDQIAVRLSANNIKPAMEKIKNTWNNIFPNTYMDYHFQDELFDNVYKSDIQFAELIYIFTCISVFIAIIGLSGLIAFSTQRRFKEIGIRKVLGANTENILYLMSKEILGVTIISFIIVTPVVFYIMKKWLDNFAYKIELSPTIFLLAGLSALLISLATVYTRVVSVASKKPSEFLKYE